MLISFSRRRKLLVLRSFCRINVSLCWISGWVMWWTGGSGAFMLASITKPLALQCTALPGDKHDDDPAHRAATAFAREAQRRTRTFAGRDRSAGAGRQR